MRHGTPFTVEKISPGAGMESGSGKSSCCYSDDHIALRPYLHGQNKMQQRMYRLRTISDKSPVERMGELNQFYWIQTLAICYCGGLKHLVSMRVS